MAAALKVTEAGDRPAPVVAQRLAVFGDRDEDVRRTKPGCFDPRVSEYPLESLYEGSRVVLGEQAALGRLLGVQRLEDLRPLLVVGRLRPVPVVPEGDVVASSFQYRFALLRAEMFVSVIAARVE